jgi:hypothetical protein
VERLPGDPELRGHAGPVVLDHHVGLGQQSAHHLEAVL